MASRAPTYSASRRGLVCGAIALLSSAEVALAQPNILTASLPERRTPERVNLLFCGDSLAQGMFLALNGQLRRRETVRVTNGTLHTTGVTRSDEPDWPGVTRDLVGRHWPNLIIFWVGANDFWPPVVREIRSRHAFGTQAFAGGSSPAAINRRPVSGSASTRCIAACIFAKLGAGIPRGLAISVQEEPRPGGVCDLRFAQPHMGGHTRQRRVRGSRRAWSRPSRQRALAAYAGVYCPRKLQFELPFRYRRNVLGQVCLPSRAMKSRCPSFTASWSIQAS